MNKRILRKLIKWFIATILSPILIFFLLLLLLCIPTIQNWAVKGVTCYASKKTGLDISINHISLSFPFDLRIDDFKMMKKSKTYNPKSDTVAYVKQLVADVQLLPLLEGKVNVNSLLFRKVKLNSMNYIAEVTIKGELERLYLKQNAINTKKYTALINTASFQGGGLDIAINDTISKDTTSQPTFWNLNFSKLKIDKTTLKIHAKRDSLIFAANLGRARLRDLNIDLYKKCYKLSTSKFYDSKIIYDRPYEPYKSKGLDIAHVRLNGFNLAVDSLYYDSLKTAVSIEKTNFVEQSGFKIDNFSGICFIDSSRFRLDDFQLLMPCTKLKGSFFMDLNAFKPKNPGIISLDINGNIYKNDFRPLLYLLPFKNHSLIPNKSIYLNGVFRGNTKDFRYDIFRLYIPNFIDLSSSGTVINPLSFNKLLANINLRASSGNLHSFYRYLPKKILKKVKLPNSLNIVLNAKIRKKRISVNSLLKQGRGRLKLAAYYNLNTHFYDISGQANRLSINNFVSYPAIKPFTGTFKVHGHGFDIFNHKTNINISICVNKLSVNSYILDRMRIYSVLHNGKIYLNVDSKNRLLNGNIRYNGFISNKNLTGKLKGCLSNISLSRFGLKHSNYLVSGCFNLSVKSNLRNIHNVQGTITNFVLNEKRNRGGVVQLIAGNFNLNASLSGRNVVTTVGGNFDNIDFYQLGAVDKPFNIKFSSNLSLSTNLRNKIKLTGKLGNLGATTLDKSYSFGDVSVNLCSTPDTTFSTIQNNDFLLATNWKGNPNKVLYKVHHLFKNFTKQLKNGYIHQLELKQDLPIGNLRLKSGVNNFFANFILQRGYYFKNADVELSSSPIKGLNGLLTVDSLSTDSLLVENAKLYIKDTPTGIAYTAQMLNSSTNKYPYKAYFEGSLFDHGLNANISLLDAKDKVALSMATDVSMLSKGINIAITSPEVIMGYKHFTVNKENYVFIRDKDKHISAQMQLKDSNGSGGIHLYTNDNDSTVDQSITIGVKNFELNEIMSLLPFSPNVSGQINGDYHIVKSGKDLSVSSDMSIHKMAYEGNNMGDVGIEFVYMPLGNGEHSVNAFISSNGKEVGTLSGSYKSQGKGWLDSKVEMSRFPLDYINGFVPDKLLGLYGTVQGALSVEGPLNKLDINGMVEMDSAAIFSKPYGIEMTFENKPLRIENSKLIFEDFNLYAKNKSPLSITGNIDFANPNRMYTDMLLRADNFQLISENKNQRSEVFGKAYIDFLGRLHGNLSKLQLDANAKLLGATDMTYVVSDDQLLADTELKNLVDFNMANDTLRTVVKRPDIVGFNMNMNFEVDPQARIVCVFADNKSNYIDLTGGGKFSTTYDATNSLRLYGKYTVREGIMKYSLPIIPLRTFTIHQGSYINFTGDPMKPLLGITATENVKSTVSDGIGGSRVVDFEVGVQLTKKFPNPGLEFIILAPDDQEMQNMLKLKSVEEQSKLAVTMLASGVYFDSSNSVATTSAMNGALLGFIQNRVNAITGKALHSMGVSITANMESTADATGSLHTDYTFKFSKRLFDNRLRIVMGGRVSTGAQMDGQNGAFFDNFAIEYRLNKRETQYLNLYYEREAFDWLEGNQGEFGIGYMWRRKLGSLKDLFHIKPESSKLNIKKLYFKQADSLTVKDK